VPTATRVLGALTAGYSIALAAQPRVLVKPLKLTRIDGSVDPTVAMLCRGIAVRDAASGLAMVLAPEGTPLTTATVVRAMSDIGDAVVFGVGLQDPGARKKTIAVASLWGVLCLLSLKTG